MGQYITAPLASEVSVAPSIESPTDGDDKFSWTPGKICLSLFLFVVAGLLEIGGGWLVWQTIRCFWACAALHSCHLTRLLCAQHLARRRLHLLSNRQQQRLQTLTRNARAARQSHSSCA